jgi:hypothetical protein
VHAHGLAVLEHDVGRLDRLADDVEARRGEVDAVDEDAVGLGALTQGVVAREVGHEALDDERPARLEVGGDVGEAAQLRGLVGQREEGG